VDDAIAALELVLSDGEIKRLEERYVPHLYELADLLFKTTDYDISRRRLVCVTKQAADLGKV
jgi:hypothetical protein